jgi:hypothetical protein
LLQQNWWCHKAVCLRSVKGLRECITKRWELPTTILVHLHVLHINDLELYLR